MNVVFLIQNYWYIIGIRLNISEGLLKKIWNEISDANIISKNVYCCCKMLAHWHKKGKDVTVGEFLRAVSIGPLGLDKKVDVMKSILLDKPSDKLILNTSPKTLDDTEKQYALMIVQVSKIINESDTDLNTFKLFLNQCKSMHSNKPKIDQEIYEKALTFTELIDALQNNGHITQIDLSWLKYLVGDVANNSEAMKVIEKYEEMNIVAHKLHWHNLTKSDKTLLMAKANMDPALLRSTDVSKLKSVAVNMVGLDDTDALLDSAGVGSVVMYWKIFKDTSLELPKTITPSMEQLCDEVGITHIGIVHQKHIEIKHLSSKST